MATYYVKTTADGGSDAAAGTSAGAAWATLGKALGAAGIASGDTVYVAPGTYRETVTVAMTSAVAETFILADPGAAQFSGVAPGPVIWSAYTTNDTTAPAAAACLNLAGRDFFTIDGFTFVGGNPAQNTGQCIATSNSAISTNVKIRNCAFLPGAVGTTNGALIVAISTGDQVALTWAIDRCVFLSTGLFSIYVQGDQAAAGADWDIGFTVTNCFNLSTNAAFVGFTVNGATNTRKPGGVKITNCFHWSSGGIISTSANNHSTSVASNIEHCIVVSGASSPIGAATAGMVTEDYNRVLSGTAWSANVGGGSPGANTVSNIAGSITQAFLIEIGQSLLHGFAARPFFTPMAGSPLLGAAAGGSNTDPSVDLFNRPRPAGGALTSAFGPLERHDTATETGSAVIAGTGNHYQITGPGDQDVTVLVDAAATDLEITMRYDTNHAATNKPQAILLANGELGVATETLTMTAAANTDETLAFTQFTPTKAGAVTVRLVSRAAAANGIAYFADLGPA